MSITLAGLRLDRIAVVDDDEYVRDSYAETLEDIGVTPVSIRGPLGDIGSLFGSALKGCDAVVTDLALKGSAYAPYDGGTIAVEGRLRRIPVVICTSYSDVNLKLPRFARRSVPAVLARAKFDEYLLKKGLEKAIGEIGGCFSIDRRPWRTQLEIVDVDRELHRFWVIVMGRSPDEKIGIYTDELPAAIRDLVEIGRLLHAKVNTGAGLPEELYFDEWEPA